MKRRGCCWAALCVYLGPSQGRNHLVSHWTDIGICLTPGYKGKIVAQVLTTRTPLWRDTCSHLVQIWGLSTSTLGKSRSCFSECGPSLKAGDGLHDIPLRPGEPGTPGRPRGPCSPAIPEEKQQKHAEKLLPWRGFGREASHSANGPLGASHGETTNESQSL